MNSSVTQTTNHPSNTTQENEHSNFQNRDQLELQDFLNNEHDQYIEMLENSKEDGRGVVSSSGNYQGSNKYSISQQDALYQKKANKKAKSFKINKTPYLMVEKPFVVDGNVQKPSSLSYNPLQDDHLRGYFLNKNVRKQIKANQLVDKEGKILDKYFVKHNSSKESQNNPSKNIAQSFQLNISNDQLYKDEINKFFEQRDSYSHPIQIKKEMKIETLQDENEIKQDLLKSYDSPRDRRRVKQLNTSQKQLVQQSIYQQTYLNGHSSDRVNPNSNRTYTKSSCGAYSTQNGNISYSNRIDYMKSKTPDPFSQSKSAQRGFKNTIYQTPSKTLHNGSIDASITSNINNNNNNNNNNNGVQKNTLPDEVKLNLEERKKMLQERKLLVKRQQLEMAKAQALQVQIKLAKQKELQQQKLLLIQKQEEQIKQYKLLMSASQTKIEFNEKSPSHNILNNNSQISNQNSVCSNYNTSTSNYLSKAPIIPSKLYNGKRPKLVAYQVNDTYTQFDKQLFQQKRCQSVESNHPNTSTSFSSHPHVSNLQNESHSDNQTILQKLNQNMIQIQQLQTQNNINSKTPISSAAKENNGNHQQLSQSSQNSVKQNKFQSVNYSQRYQNKGMTNNSNTATTNNVSKSPNQDTTLKSNQTNSTFTKTRISPFTPNKRDTSFSLNNKPTVNSKTPSANQSSIKSNNNNPDNLEQYKQQPQKQNINDKPIVIAEQQEQNKNNDNKMENSIGEESISKDQFKEYMIKQVINIKDDTNHIKSLQNSETPNEQISKEQFNSFMLKYMNKVSMTSSIVSPEKAKEEVKV